MAEDEVPQDFKNLVMSQKLVSEVKGIADALIDWIDEETSEDQRRMYRKRYNFCMEMIKQKRVWELSKKAEMMRKREEKIGNYLGKDIYNMGF